ncbi:hypothetical protein P3L10_025684 [Capsicum annuum]
MGDYNVVANVHDRIVGSPVLEIGRNFTWTNSHVFSTIDRALVNSVWLQQMAQLEVLVMDPGFSDHSPFRVAFQVPKHRDPKSFKFLNCLAEHHQFKPIKAARNHLAKLQEAMRTDHQPGLFEQKRETRSDLEIWSLIGESKLKQKSRVNWLKLRDANNSFFLASIMNRVAQNSITQLISLSGSVLQNHVDIEKEITMFYRGLLGTAVTLLCAIDPSNIKMGPVLNRDH